ncbi:hypothetical protein LTR66_014323 [Elasticomyces elasticus]|nr:hypothetical protein LTR66_014323 [Elasticomyces elasticus]
MSHRAPQRLQNTAPHAISLKVLRLSRPSLADQHPLPETDFPDELNIAPQASLACPSAFGGSRNSITDGFPITPLLTLPPAFGAAYVGETFSCTLCANNELEGHDDAEATVVSAVKIAAELAVPSNPAFGIPLQLRTAIPRLPHSSNPPAVEQDEESESTVTEEDLAPGATLQRIISHELKEEGQHTLAVTVTYTETQHGEAGQAAGGRVRTFRKLYQFVAVPLVGIRTKISHVRGGGVDKGKMWALEAQLECLGERAVVLEKVSAHVQPGLTSKSLNWDSDLSASEAASAPLLNPQDVTQVAFLLTRSPDGDAADAVASTAPKSAALAQIEVHWRGPMGEKGRLTTGWLSERSGR